MGWTQKWLDHEPADATKARHAASTMYTLVLVATLCMAAAYLGYLISDIIARDVEPLSGLGLMGFVFGMQGMVLAARETYRRKLLEERVQALEGHRT